jgi:pyrimidine deaminase RibD-like protein
MSIRVSKKIQTAIINVASSSTFPNRLGCVIAVKNKIVASSCNHFQGNGPCHAEMGSIEKILRHHRLLKAFRRALSNKIDRVDRCHKPILPLDTKPPLQQKWCLL